LRADRRHQIVLDEGSRRTVQRDILGEFVTRRVQQAADRGELRIDMGAAASVAHGQSSS
jgi:hypothetical protein